MNTNLYSSFSNLLRKLFELDFPNFKFVDVSIPREYKTGTIETTNVTINLSTGWQYKIDFLIPYRQQWKQVYITTNITTPIASDVFVPSFDSNAKSYLTTDQFHLLKKDAATFLAAFINPEGDVVQIPPIDLQSIFRKPILL